MTQLGHNNPPSALALADSCFSDVGEWLKTNPVVQTEDEARAAKVILDRGIEALREVEQERDTQVRPLREQVNAINTKYKAIHNTDKDSPGLYDKVLAEVRARIRAFMEAEEQCRLAALEVARSAAAEAERIAREAEEKERAIAEESKMGVEGDILAATATADSAFADFGRATRQVDRAERATKVTVKTDARRGLGFRRQEVLTIATLEDACAALEIMGLTDGITEAIITAARDYRKTMGELPDGITVTYERKI